jgi:translation initiation factor 2B subunit (eIF-2B alpha/beta/delta family)
VIATESLPGGEGRRLTRRLRARAVATRTIPDASGATTIAEADAVVVGADAVTARELWNKCGTRALARAARAGRRPFYVVTTGDRLIRSVLARRLRLPPSGLFDVTPLALVTAVVTEAGVMTPAEVRAMLRRQATAVRRP